jgi:hypothetical protein
MIARSGSVRSLWDPKIASTSSNNREGRSVEILRNIAASLADVTRQALAISSSSTSSKRVLPVRFSGETTRRYGVACAPASAHVCRIHRAIATACALLARTT